MPVGCDSDAIACMTGGKSEACSDIPDAIRGKAMWMLPTEKEKYFKRNPKNKTMEVIQSFTIDHTHLKPGIYISRIDKGFTTFDLRITEPNREPAVAPSAMHSLEHLMATWFRNSAVKDDVVYVGPMGCLTGMYVIMTGSYTVEDMRRLTLECLEWILTQTEVPATTPETCGNYLLHDLPMCHWEASRYAGRLKNDFHSEYTKLRVITADGKVFADA